MLRERGEAADGMLAALHANAEEALARAEAESVTARQARRQAEVAMANAETRCMTEQAAREKAEAEAAQLRQENQARRHLGLLARLRAAWRRE
jgi:hypothetical protein